MEVADTDRTDVGGDSGQEPEVPADADGPRDEVAQAGPEAVDEPTVDEPTLDEPTLDEPAVDEPAVDEPAVDEPAVDEPTAEKPTLDEPRLDEPTVEGPTLDEPTVDEPRLDEPTVEGPTLDEPTAEGPTLDEPTAEGPALDEPTVDGPEPVDPPADPESAAPGDQEAGRQAAVAPEDADSSDAPGAAVAPAEEDAPTGVVPADGSAGQPAGPPAVIPLPPVEAPARLTSGRPTPGRPTPGRPTPGRPTPGAGPRIPGPAPRPSSAADEPSALQEAMAFGRVDDDGTVFVRTAAGERVVGTWVRGEPEQALAFFARRFATLESEVELAEGRARAGALGAEATAATAERLAAGLAEVQVVGDLDGLAARIRELPELSLERREARRAEKAAAQAEARASKEALVVEAEQIALSDTWRAGPERLRELFDVWRVLPRLDKATDDALWHRFSAARTSFTRRRKAHYSELAGRRAEVKAAKEALIAEAEKLAASTDWGSSTAAERDLMARWKQVGSASKDDDDALWNRFHTARQAFFDARAAHDEERTGGEKENLAAKRAVLAEAEALVPVTDLGAARRALRGLRERWEAIGHIPRAAVAGLDTRWKAVDEAVRGAERHEWRRTDPEARRRAEQTAAQLQKSIAKLETESAAAAARGDKGAQTRADEALAARRTWLEQAEKLLTESR